jgi:hypothetical protein
MRARLGVLTGIVAAALMGTLLVSSPSAQAVVRTAPASASTADVRAAQPHDVRAAQSYLVREPYSSYRMAWVEEFNLCLGVYVTGQVRATKTLEPIEGGTWMRLSSPHLVDPDMQITVKQTCDDSSAPKTRHRANVVAYNHIFYGHTCSYDPSFSASLPWGVGVSVTPDCGDERVARHGDRQGNARNAYRFRLDTQGYAFGWNDRASDTVPTNIKLCLSAAANITLEDNDGAVRAKAIRRVLFSDPCVYHHSTS